EIRVGVRSTEPLMGDFKDTSYQQDGCFLFFHKEARASEAPKVATAEGSGNIEVLVTRPGSVYVDGKLKGVITDKGLLKIEGLEPKMCDVKVIYSDLSTEQKPIKVEKGETVLLEFRT